MRRVDPQARRVLAAGLISLIVMVVVAPWTSVPPDVATWFAASQRAAMGAGLYGQPGFSYPPVFGYWVVLIGVMFHWLGLPLILMGHTSNYLMLHAAGSLLAYPITSPLYNYLVKGPLILAVLAGGWLVWSVVVHLCGDYRRAGRAAAIWLLSPLVLFETAAHGQFDVIVAIEILSFVLARLRGQFWLAGAWIGIGVATKLVPGFLIPLGLATALFPMDDESPAGRWVHAIEFVCGGLAAGVIACIPLIIDGQVPQMLSNVFTRLSTNGNIGGLGWGGLSYIPALSGTAVWGSVHALLVGRLYELAGVASALTGGVAWAIIGVRRGSTMVALTVAVLCVYLLASPVTNPQYLLWEFAPLVVLTAVLPTWALLLPALLSVGSLYDVGIFGWAGLVLPAAAYQHLTTLAKAAEVYAAESGAADPHSLGGILMLIAWIAVFGAMLGVLIISIRTAFQVRTTSRPRAVLGHRDRRALVLGLALAVSCFLGISARSSAVSIPTPRYTARMQGTSMEISVLVQRSLVSQSILVFASDQRRTVRRVVEYIDPSMPDSGSTYAELIGLKEHLAADMTILKSSIHVRTVTAAGLVTLLRRRAMAPGTLLLLASGTVPDRVLSRRTNLLKPWIAAGGVMAWSGDVPGYYSVSPSPSIYRLTPSSATPASYSCLLPGRGSPHGLPYRGNTVLGPSGATRILGHSHLVVLGRGWTCAGQQQSPLGSLLGNTYVWTHSGVFVKEVQHLRGLVLGQVGDSVTSVAFLQVGRGGVLVFGGPTAATQESSLLARVAVSGLLEAVGKPAGRAVDAGHGYVRMSMKLRHVGEMPVRLVLMDTEPTPLFIKTEQVHVDGTQMVAK